MWLKNTTAALTATALIAGTALVWTGAPALAGAGMGGGGSMGSFLIYQPFRGPGPQPSCESVPVKYYVHGHVHWRTVERCY
jgi:hypothetical protein